MGGDLHIDPAPHTPPGVIWISECNKMCLYVPRQALGHDADYAEYSTFNNKELSIKIKAVAQNEKQPKEPLHTVLTTQKSQVRIPGNTLKL